MSRRQRTPLKLLAAKAEGSGHAAVWTKTPATALHYGLYLGPKRYDDLEKVGHDLVQAVDLGWFWFVAKPLLVGLLMIQAAVGNYGWAIVLLTIARASGVLSDQQEPDRSNEGHAAHSARAQALQEKYKDDREKLNLEMIEVYRRHKVNPLVGMPSDGSAASRVPRAL